MRDLLIVLGVVVLVILSSAWWKSADPTDRRKWVMPAWTGPDSSQTPVPADDPPADVPDDGTYEGRPYDDYPLLPVHVVTDDDAWVEQLHSINQLGKFGDLTRPIAHQTHYEIEAVIRQLADPWWVPERWRVAA